MIEVHIFTFFNWLPFTWLYGVTDIWELGMSVQYQEIVFAQLYFAAVLLIKALLYIKIYRLFLKIFL